jgi:type II secretory pathway component PulL
VPQKLTPTIILFAGDSTWQIAAIADGKAEWANVPLPENSQPSDIAAALAKSLVSIQYESQPSILFIPAQWCLAATIQTGTVSKSDCKAMLYALEEKLPHAAEELVADFVTIPMNAHGAQRALGVCVRTDLLQPLVESLEAAGVAVQSITPTSLAAIQSLQTSADNSKRIFICSERTDASKTGDSSIGVLAVEAGSLINWALLPKSASDIKLHLEMNSQGFEEDWKCEAIGVDPAFVESLQRGLGKHISLRTESILGAAAVFGEAILAGTQKPWIEFRRGPLAIADPLRQHRRSINRLLVAAIAFFIVWTAVSLLRAQRYNWLAESADARMTAAFVATFPDWAVPANLKAVVESEHRKAQSATGQTAPAEGSGSAMQTLHDVLTRLPDDGHYSLDQMSFEPDAFQIAGRLQSYEQVDAIASAARQAGLDVQTPLTRKGTDGFWTFTLRGTRSAAAPPIAAEGDGQ